MGKMTNREPNMAKWVGTRPGHNGVQVVDSAQAEDAVVTWYTVAAGKVLFLCTYAVSVMNFAAVDVTCYSYIRDNTLAKTYYGIYGRVNDGDSKVPVHMFNPPMELAAGSTFVHTTSAANVRIRSSIFGWLEDV